MEEPRTRLGEPTEAPPSTFGRFLVWGVPALVLLAVAGGWFAVNQSLASAQAKKIAILQNAGVRINERTDTSAPQWLRDMLGEDFFTTPVSVSFTSKEVDDDAIDALSTLPSVRSVDLALTDATDKHVSALQPLTNLRELFLNQTNVTGASIPVIASFQQLRKLQLSETAIADELADQRGFCPKLTQLWLDGTKVSDKSLANIGTLVELEVLSLNNTQVTGAGMVHFPELQNLQTLRLSGCPLSDIQMLHLMNIAELSTSLDVSHTPLSDNAIESLGVLTYLKTLDINGVNFSEEHIAQLKRTLPSCRIKE